MESSFFLYNCSTNTFKTRTTLIHRRFKMHVNERNEILSSSFDEKKWFFGLCAWNEQTRRSNQNASIAFGIALKAANCIRKRENYTELKSTKYEMKMCKMEHKQIFLFWAAITTTTNECDSENVPPFFSAFWLFLLSYSQAQTTNWTNNNKLQKH